MLIRGQSEPKRRKSMPCVPVLSFRCFPHPCPAPRFCRQGLRGRSCGDGIAGGAPGHLSTGYSRPRTSGLRRRPTDRVGGDGRGEGFSLGRPASSDVEPYEEE